MKYMLQLASRVVLACLVATLGVATTSGQAGQSQKGSEANHFIETPPGWTHPKTA